MGDQVAQRPRDPGSRAGLPGLLLAAFAAALLSSSACSGTPTLAAALPSDEALAHAVLDGIARRDADALMGLAVTREEFEEIVWPALPASRPEVGMPASYVWQDTSAKSRAYLASTLAEYGGRRFTLLRVDTRGRTTDHGTHTISRETHLMVRDAAGQQHTLRLFGSIIRQHGRSKVYSYIVN